MTGDHTMSPIRCTQNPSMGEEWRRGWHPEVYRARHISRMRNVEAYLESPMTANEVLDYDFDHVAVATGSTWRRDGVGRWHTHPMPTGALAILTPDDLMDGRRPDGERVAIFDDDHFYMGGVLAELLRGEGYDVVIVTARLPEDSLLGDLVARRDEWARRGPQSVRAIGDALAPGTIAAAAQRWTVNARLRPGPYR